MSDSSFEEDDDSEVESSEDIRIDAPREPEINPDVYRDVSVLINRGFLMASSEINGIPFVFKTLNQNEYEMVKLLSGYMDDNATFVPPRFWDLFLAHMVLFVDGQNVLTDRSKYLADLADTFRDMPNALRVRFIRLLSELNRKSTKAAMLVEAYSTENYSRWRRAQVQSMDICSPSLTGIDGTHKLGLSYVQLVWRALNHYEDIRNRQEVDWENAKFIGGCFAGKGIQKIYNRDNDRRTKERQEKWSKKDRIVRHVVLGEPLEKEGRFDGSQIVQVASTVEELADQVEKSLRGEKDWHDLVIDEYESKLRAEASQKQSDLQNLAKTRKSKMKGKDVMGEVRLEGLSPQQVQQRIYERQRQSMQGYKKESEEVSTEDASLTRWGFKDPGFKTTDRSTDDAIPLQPPRNTGKPWRP